MRACEGPGSGRDDLGNDSMCAPDGGVLPGNPGGRGNPFGRHEPRLRNRVIVEAILGAGLRVSETCALKGVDVDLAEGTIRVNLGKGKKDRVVPVDNETLAWLRAWAERREALGLNGRAPFFPAVHRNALGKPLSPLQVQRMVASAARRAGIEGKRVSPHVLRHTYATRLLREGFTIREVQELLGHASDATTQIYTHVDPQALKEKVQGRRETEAEKIARAVLEVLPPDVREALQQAAKEQPLDHQ